MAPDAGSLGRRLAAGAAALLLSQGAAAQFLYVCTVGGHTVTGQVPPAECRNVDVRELNPDGTLHRLIPAPMTREQRQKKEEAQEEQLRKEEEDRAQARRDRSLLETYSSVDEIEAARSRDLAGRKTLIDRADARIAQYTKEKKRLDDEAEFYVNREMPPKLKEQFATNKTLTDQQVKTRADSVAEMSRINEKYNGFRKRFEEIQEQARIAEDARRKAVDEAEQQQQQDVQPAAPR
jgi:hypothetical protein